ETNSNCPGRWLSTEALRTSKPVQRAERPEREPSPARSASAGNGTSPSLWKASGVCGCCEPGTARAPVALSIAMSNLPLTEPNHSSSNDYGASSYETVQ